MNGVVLTLNAGSSSIKFAVYRADAGEPELLAKGQVEGIGSAPHFLASILDAAVINAGDGAHEHPTQGLLDIFTLREKWGDLKDRKVVIVGDIKHSRVARSNIHGLVALGADVTRAEPLAVEEQDKELPALSRDVDFVARVVWREVF